MLQKLEGICDTQVSSDTILWWKVKDVKLSDQCVNKWNFERIKVTLGFHYSSLPKFSSSSSFPFFLPSPTKPFLISLLFPYNQGGFLTNQAQVRSEELGDSTLTTNQGIFLKPWTWSWFSLIGWLGSIWFKSLVSFHGYGV